MSAESLEFRNAVPQEVGAIALVIARANAQRDGIVLPNAIEDTEALDLHERMNRPHAWTYVATKEDEIAGVALGYPRIDEDVPAADAETEYLSLLMVEPNAWGQGIASRLLDLVAERARNAGRSKLALWTRGDDNEHARVFYEHKGFVFTEQTRLSKHGQQVEYQLTL